ncbi:MAG: phosphate signaling complex protein PhoU [Candidatus Margulisiibacteriota bacterium]
MRNHFEREIEELKKKFLVLSTLVEENLQLSAKALATMDNELADQVIKADDEVDMMEIAVEEECLKILALYQPVAVNLRFIVAVLKITNDLERISDLAINIAKKIPFLVTDPVPEAQLFPIMIEKVKGMLKLSLDSLVQLDTQLARNICVMDKEIDNLKSDCREKLVLAIKKNPEKVETYLNWLSISRHLERIADHATNVAEDVIYMAEGEIIRHSSH